MRMLVVGTLPSATEPAVAQLEDAGHEVVSCHDPGEGPFPCRALSGRGACPLDGAPVDVVVTVRNRAWAQPSPYEDGAVCALRRHIPMVLAGVSALSPFDRWSPRTVDDGEDLVAACEEAATAPLPELGATARDVARLVVATAGRDGDVDATVWRQHGGLRVELTLPDGCADLAGKAAARVTGALRALDQFATVIDVAVETVAATPTDHEPQPGASGR